MIRIGKSRIERSQKYSQLCADIQIDEKTAELYFRIDYAQEKYLCQGRADAFVVAILPLAIRHNHSIVCEDVISERLHYQLNEYFIPTLIFEKGEEEPISIQAEPESAAYPNQGAIGTVFSDDVHSLYTIMQHGKDCEYPLTHMLVIHSGAFERGAGQELFQEKFGAAVRFAREQGLETIFAETNFCDVLEEDFQKVSTFLKLSCMLALQGLFSVCVIPSVYQASQFKVDLEDLARCDLLTAMCINTESMAVYLSGSEMNYEEKLRQVQEWESTGRLLYTVSSKAKNNFIEKQKNSVENRDDHVRGYICIKRPYIIEREERSFLYAEIIMSGTRQKLWFSVKPFYGEYLTEEVSDAFVAVLLMTAMREDMDIRCEGPLSRRFLHQMNHYLIPMMSGCMQEYHFITVYAEASDIVLKCAGAVGTGWTGGVDCMFTYMRHFDIIDKSYQLSHLLIANNGAMEGKTRETLEKMTRKAEMGFAEETGLKVIDVDTNLQEVLTESFISVESFRLGAVALALQKLFGVFLISSSMDFARFSFEPMLASFYEMVVTDSFVTDCTVVYSGGGAFSRIRKLKELADFSLAQRYLHPCIYALRENCGKCDKCLKTETALYGLGELEKFSKVFDVEGFSQQKEWYLKNLLFNKKSIDCADTLELLAEEIGDLISIIVPVYNSEPYIRDCIQSIQKQSHINFEVILVDDGSTDRGRGICEEITKTDPRFRVLAQEHKGVSAARNRGMKAAEGKYVFFLDSDDMIHPELLKNLYQLLEKNNAAMAMESYCREEEEFRNMCSERTEGVCSRRYTNLGNQRMLWEFLMYGEQGGIGGKMIRHTFLQSREFDERLVTGEDTKFIYQLITDGADAVILYQDWYYYRRYEKNTEEKQTVKAWKSIYESMRYICTHENANGRMINAIRCEEHIIRCMMGWKHYNMQAEDQEAAQYLKDRAEAEKELEIFAGINWHLKMDFYLMFSCYPIYCLYHKLADICHNKKDVWQIENENRLIEERRKKNKGYKGKISVIIPVYHSEAYVGRCIQSVISQSYTDLEIIVINGGATDQSVKICEELSASDDRIKLYAQENKGASSARNCGLDLAGGKYVFLLDSDDAIHPLLLEELLWQAEDSQAGIALCEYSKLYAAYMEKVLDGISVKDERPQWRIIDDTESEEWIHKKYYDSLMRVGVLIRRDVIGTTRFSENLRYGGDALFLYHLSCKKLRIAYSANGWYYHRLYHGDTFPEEIKNERYFDIYRMLRDEEYQRGHHEFAMLWERRLVWMLRENFVLMKGKEEQCRILKKQAVAERNHPLFKKLTVTAKALFFCCFSCYPVYSILRKPVKVLDRMVWAIGTGMNGRKGDCE